jgi:hypothetical protein
MTIEEIQKAVVVGNAWGDRLLLDAIHNFACDESKPTKDRCLALQKLDQVMGVEGEVPTEGELRQYIEEQV